MNKLKSGIVFLGVFLGFFISAPLLAQTNSASKSGIKEDQVVDTSHRSARKLNYHLDSAELKTPPVISSQPKIFGADLFRNSVSNTFEPNLKLATPVNYIVGPDDQLKINVYGNSLANWNLDVSPEGNINIPGVGILKVGGKTIEQATSDIKNKLIANHYAIGHGTSVSVSLGNIRSIKVILQGQLVKPGTYTLTSLATVFNALFAAGGPNDVGSFRQIEVIRNNRIVRHLDLYDFLVKGSQKDNIALQDQDVIRVPTYRTRVELSGEVKIPSLFETLPGETLDDVIKFAGGFTDQAYTARIEVIQISDQQQRITDIIENDYKNYIPLRGDKYIVQRILNRFENRVVIAGAVFRPGQYELQKGLTLLSLIKNASGLKEDAFTSRGNITRLNADNSLESIPFNLKDIINKTAADIPLQREDSIYVYSIFDLRDKYRVTINGEVRAPGSFAYADKMNVEDLIAKAGGFTEGASRMRIEVARRVYDSDPASKGSIVAQVFTVNVDSLLKPVGENFILQPFDVISVYSLPGYEKQKTVYVQGEVIYPGPYTIKTKNEKISDIMKRAGGLTASADVAGGTLKRSNLATLGIPDKSKNDSTTFIQERATRLKQLQHNTKDTTNAESVQLRNDYVGIDLKQILDQPGSKTDLILEDGDIIRIPKQQQVVKINGEVWYPSAVVYSEGKGLRGYISNAGGFAPSALKRSVYVVYPNGTVKATHKFLVFKFYPEVKPGSEIYVPAKPVKPLANLQETIAIAGSLATLAAIVLGILSFAKH